MADPTYRQIAMMADEVGITDYPAAVRLVRRAFEVSRSARAALAEPAPPAAGEVGEGVTDEEWYALVDRLWDKYQTVGPQGERSVYEYAFLNACEEIARYGRYPEPAPPAEGEVAELVARLRRASDGASAMGWEQDSWAIARAAELLQQQQHPTPVPVPKGPTRDDLWELWLRLNNELPDRPAAVAEFWEHAQIDARAADLLERQAAPVAVSDRLPGPEDCDAEGRCWAWRTDGADEFWELVVPLSNIHEFNLTAQWKYTHWLPAHALPLPTGEVE